MFIMNVAMKTTISVMQVGCLVLIILCVIILGFCLIRFLYRKYGDTEMSPEEQQSWEEHKLKQVCGNIAVQTKSYTDSNM